MNKIIRHAGCPHADKIQASGNEGITFSITACGNSFTGGRISVDCRGSREVGIHPCFVMGGE